MTTGLVFAVLLLVAYGGTLLLKYYGLCPNNLASGFFATASVYLAVTRGLETNAPAESPVRTVFITELSPDEEYVHDLELENALLRKDNAQLIQENARFKSRRTWYKIESFVGSLTCPVFTGYYEARSFAYRYYQCDLPIILNGRYCVLTKDGPMCWD